MKRLLVVCIGIVFGLIAGIIVVKVCGGMVAEYHAYTICFFISIGMICAWYTDKAEWFGDMFIQPNQALLLCPKSCQMLGDEGCALGINPLNCTKLVNGGVHIDDVD